MWVRYVYMWSVVSGCPANCPAQQNLFWWTLHANFWTRSCHACHIRRYHWPLSLFIINSGFDLGWRSQGQWKTISVDLIYSHTAEKNKAESVMCVDTEWPWPWFKASKMQGRKRFWVVIKFTIDLLLRLVDLINLIFIFTSTDQFSEGMGVVAGVGGGGSGGWWRDRLRLCLNKL